MAKYDWLKDIDFEQYLDNDARLIAKELGYDVMARLYILCSGMPIYFSKKKILSAKAHVNGTKNLDYGAQMIAKEFGDDILYRLYDVCDGKSIYFSKKQFLRAREEYIQKNFDGSNHKTLAAVLGVTVRYVYKCIEKQRKCAANSKSTKRL